MTPLRTAEPIAGYTVTERIGAGGYGEVWRAEAPGGLVKAIKFVYGYLSDERAARELKALNRIKQTRHPFLLSLERIEVVEGQLVIVTELADMSLKDRFQQCQDRGGAIPRDELLNYLRDTADALDYLTENKLQHLDIKPENILLLGGRVKVADFGLVKDIQERTCSMLGGMTPIYAAPEVFDGRPSRHSDQYSLAILYQEMLTGILPFPGTTSAQLAAQHLHSRPQLEPLPPADRPIIARALAKDPAQRFPNCRQMVECLLAGSLLRGDAPPGLADPTRDTTPVGTQPTEPGAAASSPLRRTPTPVLDSQHMTEALGRLGAAPMASDRPSRSSWVRLATATPVVDLPPVELAGEDLGLRPTLVVGVGGTAAWTLRRLRARLQERFGSMSDLPIVQMLLLDTDPKELAAAAGGDERSGLDPRDTLTLSLRKPQDYREESRDMLRWLSRRWLFNIPRSLQTEGLRPLGRLALVDHAQECFARFQAALDTLTSAESLATARAATNLPIRNPAPRVFLVANVAGGTGSGMVLDLVFALRSLLAGRGYPEAGLCTILAHSSSRKPSAKDLAVANTCACLTELRHYLHVSGYPGETACGLSAWPATQMASPATYVVHLGDELSGAEFRAATDALADYLYLDIATPAGGFLDKCRQPAAVGPDSPPAVRTFGIHRVGCSESAIPVMLGEVLCRGLVDLWTGDARGRTRSDRPSDSFGPTAEPGPAPANPVDALVGRTLQDLRLSAAALIDQIRGCLEQALSGQLEPLVESRLAAAEPGASSSQVLDDLAAALGLTGNAPAEDVVVNLPLELEAFARTRGAEASERLQRCVLECVETPELRLAGAAQTRQKMVEALAQAEAEALEARDLAQHELDHFLFALSPAATTSRRGRGWAGRGSPVEQKADALEFVRRRTTLLAAAAAAGLLKLLVQRLSALGDRLTDYRRDVTRLAGCFDPPPGWAGAGGLQPSQVQGLDKISLAVVTNLRSRLPGLAAELDELVQRAFLARQGGLLMMIGRGADAQRHFVGVLRGLARKVISRALQEIDVTRIVLESAQDEGADGGGLRRCVERAQPRLLGCGGGRRLLILAPESPTSSTLAEVVQQASQQAPAVLADADCDLLACCEMENVPLDGVAAKLVESSPQCLELARRLHTRVDVEWCDLAEEP